MLLKKLCNVCTTIGSDWNCTVDFIKDRNGEEPHHGSSSVLSNILKEFELTDIWRRRNIGIKQYTWLKVSNIGVSGARLDFIFVKNGIIKLWMFLFYLLGFPIII